MYVRSRNFGRAEALRQQALELRKASHGEKHPLYATQLKTLAIVYEYLGQYDKAEPLLLQALEIFQKTKGEESSEYINVLGNLAYAYENMGCFRPPTYSFAPPPDVGMYSVTGIFPVPFTGGGVPIGIASGSSRTHVFSNGAYTTSSKQSFGSLQVIDAG